jgi:hypothetical protein
VPDRRYPADHFIRSVVDQRRVFLQQSQLIGTLNKRVQSAGQ